MRMNKFGGETPSKWGYRKRNPSRKAVIYVLVDPRDSRIYYVGSTYNKRARLSQHITVSKNNHSGMRKPEWIKSVVDDGLCPIMIILERTTSETRKVREDYWIDLLAKLGAPLTNCIPGIKAYYVDRLAS